MPCAPAGKYHQGMMRRALRPFQTWQSLNSVVGACSSPYSVVGAAFNLRVKNPTQTYDNHYIPRWGSHPLQGRTSSHHAVRSPQGCGSTPQLDTSPAGAGRDVTTCRSSKGAASSAHRHPANVPIPDTVWPCQQGCLRGKERPGAFGGASWPLVFPPFSDM